MTRARDRLIMTYADQRLEATLQDLAMRIDLCPLELLTRDVNCPGEWILQSAFTRAEAGALFARSGRPRALSVSDYPWMITVGQARIPANTDVHVTADEQSGSLPEQLLAKIEANLAFRYPHQAATAMASKQTATQLKGREKDEEAAQNSGVRRIVQRNWRKPSFKDASKLGCDYGNAIHKVLQYIRYDACGDPDGVKREVLRLVEEHFVTSEQAQAVDCEKISRFFNSELGTKLRLGSNVLREFKFSILDDADRYGDGLENEQVLLQGVVDCAILEEDGITILDFKTDYVTEHTIQSTAEKYRVQIETYGDALERIYKKPIKQKILYFFQLNQFIPI
jgi:ATP-dependent helicase/nuclease subunit A